MIMPVIKSYNIVTNDIRNNDNVFFMYLENKKRIGGGHIAMLLRDSSHALPLTVKKSNGQGILHYFTKDDVATATDTLITQFSFVRDILNRGCVVVFPMECLVDNEFVEDVFKEASSSFADNFFSRLNNLFETYKAKRYVA